MQVDFGRTSSDYARHRAGFPDAFFARLVTEAGLGIDFQQAPAEHTGLPSGAFNLVVAGQCWHWFDRSAAAREALLAERFPEDPLAIPHRVFALLATRP